MRYLFVDINSAKRAIHKRIGYDVRMDSYYYKLLDRVNSYEKQMNDLNYPLITDVSKNRFARICKNFDAFCKRHEIN